MQPRLKNTLLGSRDAVEITHSRSTPGIHRIRVSFIQMEEVVDKPGERKVELKFNRIGMIWSKGMTKRLRHLHVLNFCHLKHISTNGIRWSTVLRGLVRLIDTDIYCRKGADGLSFIYLTSAQRVKKEWEGERNFSHELMKWLDFTLDQDNREDGVRLFKCLSVSFCSHHEFHFVRALEADRCGYEFQFNSD